jgi:hypothetical protein
LRIVGLALVVAQALIAERQISGLPRDFRSVVLGKIDGRVSTGGTDPAS